MVKRSISYMLVIVLIFTQVLGMPFYLPFISTENEVYALENTVLPIKYDDFSEVTELQFNGSAVQSGNTIIVSPSLTDTMGTIFSKQKIKLKNENSFSTYFSFQLTDKYDPWGSSGADGFTFLLQPFESTAINDSPSAPGFGITEIRTCAAIEFDTFKGGSDPSACHIGININGSNDSLKTANLSTFSSGTTYHAWIDYDGLTDTIEVRCSNSNIRPANANLTYTNLDFQSLFGNQELYAGFSAASGQIRQNHIISKWYFDNEYNPIDVNNAYTEAGLMSIASTQYAERMELVYTITDHLGNPAQNINLNASASNGTLSSTSGVTDVNGQVILDLTNVTENQVTITAETETGVVLVKTITVEEIMTDAECVATDTSDLTVEDILNTNTSSDNILTDLTLPTTGGAGSSISWLSSNTSYISHTGAVIRPTYTAGDQSVTLEATISKGTESAKKSFEMIVKSLSVAEEDTLEEDYEWLTTERILNGNTGIDDIKDDLNFPLIAPKGSEIIWESGDSRYIHNDGTVTRPAYADGNQVVAVTAILKRESLKKAKYFSFNVKKDLPADADVLKEDKNWLYTDCVFGDDSHYNKINSSILGENDSQYNVINNLELLDMAPNGSNITWSSSDISVISNNGVVNRPGYAVGSKEITLAAELSKGTESDTIYFDFTVPSMPDYQSPVFVSVSPEAEKIRNDLSTITYTFDEPIKSESLNDIEYYKKTDAGYTEPVFGIAQIEDKQLKIEIIGETDDYDLQIIIPAHTVADFSGNHYGEVIKKEFYYRAKKPVLISSNPINEAKNIPANVPISFTFDEAIKINASRILFRKLTTEKNWYGGSYTRATPIPFQASVSNEVLDIIPIVSLEENRKYNIQIASDAVKNSKSKTLNESINIVFETVHSSGSPKIVAYTEKHLANTSVLITFDKQIKIDQSKILQYGRSSQAEFYVEGNKLYIKSSYSNLPTLTFKQGAVKSLVGEEAVYPKTGSWRRVEKGWMWWKEVYYTYTPKTEGYTYTNISPQTGDYVAIDRAININYPKEITLKDPSNASKSIQLTNSRGQDLKLSISVEKKKLSIRPESQWLPYVSYYVHISDGAVLSGETKYQGIDTFVKVPSKAYINGNFTISKTKVFENKTVRLSADHLSYLLGRSIRNYSYKTEGVEISNAALFNYTPTTEGKKQIILDIVDEYGYDYTFKKTIEVLDFNKANTTGNISKPDEENLYNHTEIEDQYETRISLQNKGIVLDNEEVTASICKRKYTILDLFFFTLKIPAGYDEILTQTQKTDATGTAAFIFDIDSLESGEYAVKYSSPKASKLPEHYLNIKKLSDMAVLKIKLVDKNTEKVVAKDKTINVIINDEVYKASKNSNNQYIIEDLLPLKSTIKVSHSYYYDETIEKDLWPFMNEMVVKIERDIPSDKPVIRYIKSNQTDSRDSEKKIFINGISNVLTFNTYFDWKGHEPGQLEFIAKIPDKNGNMAEKKFYSKDGKLRLNIGKDLGASATMIVRAISKDGTVSASHDLGFEVAPRFPVGSVLQKDGKYLINLNMSLSEIGGASIPDDWPLVGGDDLELDLETLRFGGILTSDGNVTFNYGYTPGILEQIKDNGNVIDNIKELNDMRKGGKFSSGDKDFGMSLDGQVKWQYRAEENAWYFRHGEVEIKVEGELSYTQYFWLFVVPAYLRGTLSVEVAAKLEVDRPKEAYDFSGTLGIEPGVEIALGAGVDGLNLEGFLGGYIGTEFAFPSCDFSAEGTLEGGARASVLFWSWEKKAIEYTWEIYRTAALITNHSAMEGMLLGTNVLMANGEEELYTLNQEAFSLMARNIGSESKWVANTPVVMGASMTPSDITRKVLKSNVFPNAEPKLISQNGEAVLIWTDDNPERTSANRTELYYAQYNEGLWNDPKSYGIDGTADFSADAISRTASAIDTETRTEGAIETEPRTYGAITAWTDMNKIFGETVTMEEHFSSGEIAAAVLENGRVESKETLTDDAYYDSMARVIQTNDQYMTVWVKNKGNSILSPESGQYDLCYSVKDDSGWNEETVIEGDLNPIVQLDVASNENKAVAVYTIDTDNNILTNGDWEMYATVYQEGSWSRPVQLTSNAISDGNPRVVYNDATEMIFWLQNGQLYMQEGLYGEAKVASPDIKQMITGFEVTQNSEGMIALTYVTSGLDGNQHLGVLLYDTSKQTISVPIDLISSKNSYAQLTPTYINDDEIMVAFTETEVITETIDGKEYKNVGDTDLVVLCKKLIHDLKVNADDVQILTGNGAPDSTNKVSVTIRNNGDFPKSNVTFRFTDRSGNAISQDFIIPEIIPAKGSVTKEVEWIIPLDYNEDTAVIQIDPDRALHDVDRTNNSAEFNTIEYEIRVDDLEIEKAEEDHYSIQAEVLNVSGKPLSDCELSLYHEGLLGDVIMSHFVGDMESGERKRVTLQWDASTLFESYDHLRILAVAHNHKAQVDETNGFWFEVKKEDLKVMATFPEKEAYHVSLNQIFELQFNKNIEAGGEWDKIVLYDEEGEIHPVTTALEGAVLKVTPLSDLSKGAMYTLMIPVGAVQSSNGQTLARDYKLDIFTLDTTHLGIVNSYPSQGMEEVGVDDDITVNFTNDLKQGDLFKEIKVYDQNEQAVAIEKQVSGHSLKIKAKNNWKSDTAYTVEIPEVSLYDTGNKPLDNFYAISFNTEVSDEDSSESSNHSGHQSSSDDTTLNPDIIEDDYVVINASEDYYEVTRTQLADVMTGESGVEIDFSKGTIRLPKDFIEKEIRDAENISMHIKEAKVMDVDNISDDKTLVSKQYDYTLSVDDTPITQTKEKLSLGIPVDISKLKDPKKAVAYYLNEMGEWIPVGGKYHEESQTLRIKTNQLGAFIILEGDKTFADVKHDWSKKAIEILASRDIIKGKNNTDFDPGASITRSEFTALIVRALYEGKTEYTKAFGDIQSASWYAEEVQRAVDLDLVSGIGNGSFAPESEITREQICTILHRVINKYSKLNIENRDIGFMDAADISEYATEPIQALAYLEIIHGYDNQIMPQKNATREEAAVMLYRLLTTIQSI